MGDQSPRSRSELFSNKNQDGPDHLGLAGQTGGGGYAYPAERLDEVWKEVLLYQFHDILPGSSIKRVYDECNARYEVLLAEVEALLAHAHAALAAGTTASPGE